MKGANKHGNGLNPLVIGYKYAHHRKVRKNINQNQHSLNPYLLLKLTQYFLHTVENWVDLSLHPFEHEEEFVHDYCYY